MIIHVKVVPNSKVEGIEELGSGELKIKVREKPIDGKANERVVEMLAEHFSVGKDKILIKNPNSRKKIVEIKT